MVCYINNQGWIDGGGEKNLKQDLSQERITQ